MTLSDGRTIKVEGTAVVMVQTDGRETVICYMTTAAQAEAEAAQIAAGIEFDLRWMAR
jgi:hypothetical protein